MSQIPLTVRAEHERPDGTCIVREVSSEQLHEHACVVCGCVNGQLAPYGHVYTRDGEDGRLGWSVRACAADRSAAA